MKTTLKTFTVEELCDGFQYNELEGKGLFGLKGQLIIQPEFQRNYLYAENNGEKEVAVVDSLLNGYPLGLIYFNKRQDGKYEILDGQQRVTSAGRFLQNKFAVKLNDLEQYFSSLPEDKKNKILKSEILVYICEGEESEIKQWFKTINIVGIPLTNQELLNAIYSGKFITEAKSIFSNSQNSNMQKWQTYVKGNPKRQEILEVALNWIAAKQKVTIDSYLGTHRNDDNINEIKMYFETIIEWANSMFKEVHPEMKGLDWNLLYETYHSNGYNKDQLNSRVEELFADEYVTNKRGIFEYVLGDEENKKLLNIRIFEKKDKQKAYDKQTTEAKKNEKSNCPLCALDKNKKINTKIYKLTEMDADHVTAWSKGGSTDLENCQMLCKMHNRSKGNS